MAVIFTALAPVFALIAFGFALRKSGLISADKWTGVELVCFWLLFPALLITTMARAQLSLSDLAGLAAALLTLVVVVSAGLLALRAPVQRALAVSGPTWTSLFQTTTRWHGFIAFAIVERLLGADGLVLLAVAFAVMIPFLQTVNMVVLARYAADKPLSWPMVGRQLGRNPILWGIVLGIAINLLRIDVPEVVERTLDLLGKGALGVSLLAMGAALSWRALLQARAEVTFTVLGKLVATPLLAWLIADLFAVEANAFLVMMIAAAVPTATNATIIARAMGGDVELCAAAATAQVVVSVITLPAIIWLAGG